MTGTSPFSGEAPAPPTTPTAAGSLPEIRPHGRQKKRISIPGEIASPPPTAPAQEAGVQKMGCPMCSGIFQVPPDSAGTMVSCPHCQSIVQIPPASPEPSGLSSPPTSPETPQDLPTSVAVPPDVLPNSALSDEPVGPPTSVPDSHLPPPPLASSPPPSAASVAPGAPATSTPPTTVLPAQEMLPREATPPATPTSPPASTPPPHQQQDDATPPPTETSPSEEEQTPIHAPNGDTLNTADVVESADTSNPISSQARDSDKSKDTRQAEPQQPAPLSGFEQAVNEESSPPASSSIASPSSPGGDEDDEDWLPPAVEDGQSSVVAEEGDGAGGDLLPPSASSATPGEQVALPTGAALAAASQSRDGTLAIPTEEGQLIELHDPVKTVGDGDEEVELRQLTPEEKAARRFRKNLVVWTIGLIVLVVTMYCMR